MAKKKRDLSVSGVFNYLLEKIGIETLKDEHNKSLEDIEKLRLENDSLRKDITEVSSMLSENINYLKKEINKLAESIQNGGGGTGGALPGGSYDKVETIKPAEGEEDKEVKEIQLNNKLVLPGSVNVVLGEDKTLDYTVHYTSGKITLKEAVKVTEEAPLKITYKFRDMNLPKVNSFEGKIKGLSIDTSGLVSPSVLGVVTEPTGGKQGEFAYDPVTSKFKTTSSNDFSIDGLVFDNDRIYNRKIEITGRGSKVEERRIFFLSEHGKIFPYVHSAPNVDGSLGETWAKIVNGNEVVSSTSGSPSKYEVTLLTDYTAGKLLGLSEFNPTEGTKVEHNLKLDPSKYTVLVQALEDPNGELGDIYITGKTENSFVVNNTGTSKVPFAYFIVEK